MSVSVLLYTSKTLANGEHPIMIRLIKDRKSKYISIGQSSKPEWWDMNKQQPNRKHPNRRELEMLIDEKKKDARKLEIELEISKPNFTASEYGAKFRNDVKRTTVFKFFDMVIDDMLKAGSMGNSRAFKDAKNSFYNFRNGKDLTFAEWNPFMLTRYEQYMRERKVVGNTIGVYCRAFRAVYNKAIVEGYALKVNYPFTEFKVSKLKSNVSKRAIPHADIQKIETIDLSKHAHLQNSRNYFLFSFYCMGINFIDMSHLRWADVEGGRIQYTRSKTGKKFNFKIIEPALKILQHYQEETTDVYVFPILHSERHTTAASIDNRYKKKLKQTNKDLKEICQLTDIKTKLTTYVARHSAATVLKKQGLSTSIIKELMGHETESMTQNYLDSFENDTLDLALEGLK